MGVDLGGIVEKNTISLDYLNGKVIAIDAYNMIYQFLSSIRQEDGTPLMDFKGNPTAHLSGLFYRTTRFLEHGIKPVFVFDGKASDLKRKTIDARNELKLSANEKWKKAIEEEKFEEAKKYAQATSRLTMPMVEESKKFLKALGVPFVQAPVDGEAQASVMVQKGLAYATGSQDYDALLFGSDRLVRNISITGRRKIPRQDKYILVETEEIVLSKVLSELKLTREQLILVGIMVGTDFNDGVKGIGPKKALKIVSEVKSLNELVAYLKEKHNFEFEVDIEEVYKMFIEPPFTDPGKIIFEEPKKEEIKKILVEEHDFNLERVEKTVDELIRITKEKGNQSKLEQWF